MARRRVSRQVGTNGTVWGKVPWWSPSRARRVVVESVFREGGKPMLYDYAYGRTERRADGKIKYHYRGRGYVSANGTPRLRRLFNR